MTILLETRNVGKLFTSGGGWFKSKIGTVALENFSLTIEDQPPIFMTVAGESGSGKTTLANLLLGFLNPTRGQVLYRGQDLWQMSSEGWQKFRQEVQAIFQDPFEVYNPFYKIDYILHTPIKKFGLAQSRAEAHDLIIEALNNVGLNPDDTLGRYPHQLSGGQRQRVTIARALLLRPRLIIADEPVSMVDASLRATILESLRSLYQDFGISFIYITHDLTTAYQMSDNIIILYQGVVAEAGDVEGVIKNPQHPYTQELVASIPLPDPERRWTQRVTSLKEPTNAQSEPKSGCKYVDRCPRAMPECYEAQPPLYQTADSRATACYLYQEAPTLASEKLAQVLPRQAKVIQR